VGGGRGRLAGSGRDLEKGNSRSRDSSLVITDRAVAIAWGEMCPKSGMALRLSVTRLLADESSFGSGGKMQCPSTRVFADVGQICPRTNQEVLGPHNPPKLPDLSDPGMASASLLRICPRANWSYQ